MSSSTKVLCHCDGRCGGPNGHGKLFSIATVYKHKKADRDAVEAARRAQVFPVAGRSTDMSAPSRQQPFQATAGVGTRNDGGNERRVDLNAGDGMEGIREYPLPVENEMVRLFA